MPVSSSVNHFLVVLWMVDGANGHPGLNAPPHVGAGLEYGHVSVITPPLREEADSAQGQVNS